MTDKRVYGFAGIVAIAVAGGLVGFRGSNLEVETTDFGAVKTAVAPAFDAALKPASGSPTTSSRC